MTSTLAAQQKVSSTAIDCAAMRAMVFEWTRCRSFDYLAADLVGGPSASPLARLGVALARLGAHGFTRFLSARKAPGADVFMFARCAVPDALARAALAARDDAQIVILGAGLDTSGLRIGAERRAAGHGPGAFFEVDLPETQAEKRRMVAQLLRQHDTLREDHIVYAACSFGQDELGKVLLAAGFDPARPTLWIWSGVVHYLTDEAVRSTVAELKALSAPGSQLFFDFILLEAYRDPPAYGFAQTKARFDAYGEVMSFGFHAGTEHVSRWLGEQGLSFVRSYTHEDMCALYEHTTGCKAPSRGTPWANLCVAAF